MSDVNYINADIDRSEGDAAQIENAAGYLQADSLNPNDDRTTLYANENLHEAFTLSQSLIMALGEAMDKEAQNIHSVGVTFEQYDQMLADLQGGV